MKKTFWRAALLGCASSDPALGPLWKERFVLAQGSEYSLPLDMKASLFLFIRPDCPVANASGSEMKRLVAETQSRGIASVLVYAEADLEPWKSQCHEIEFDLGCPAILDRRLVLAGRVGVTVTPEAAILPNAGELLHRGRIDDGKNGVRKGRPQATRRDLRDALEAALAGRRAPWAWAQGVGSPIERPARRRTPEDFPFSKGSER